MADLNKQFDEAMFAIYRQAKEEIKYNASFFLQMLDRYKGQVTAKQLINSSKPSDGFTTLWERSVAALTLPSKL